MRITLLIFNLLAALLVLPAMHLMETSWEMDIAISFEALKEERILDEAQLNNSFPTLAGEYASLRIADWTSDRGRSDRTWWYGVPCTLAFLTNALIVGFGLVYRRKTTEQSAGERTS